jgi:hypothetical protein
MNINFEIYNLVLSEISTHISSDQIIIEDCLKAKESRLSRSKLNSLINRNKYNILLMSQLVFICRYIADAGLKNTSLINSVQSAGKIFDNQLIEVESSREKPLIDVIGDKTILISIIKILLSLIMLEDIKTKKVKLSFRRRGDYVTLKMIGGSISQTEIFYKDIENLLNSILVNYSASVKFIIKSGFRVVFLRLHLSNQMSLGYNK